MSPIFNFKCSLCGERFEELIRKKEDYSLVRCPECGSNKYEKLMSTPANPVFKGNGFYATDYKGK